MSALLSPLQSYNQPQLSVVPTAGLLEQVNLYDQQQVQQQRVNRLLQLYGHARMMKQFHYKRWKRNYEYYMSWDAEIKAKKDYQSKIFVPRPFLVVETKTPRMVQGTISKDPIWVVKPQSKDDDFKARVSSEVITYQARTHDNLILEFTTWFKDACIYGGSIGKSGWEFKMEPQTRRQPVGPFIDPISGQFMFSEQTITENVVTVDRPYFKNVDIGEFFPDPSADTIESCKFVIHQQMVSYVDLMMLQQLGVYQNVEKIQRSNQVPFEFDDFANRRFSVNNLNAPSTIPSPVYDMCEILEFWWTMEDGRKFKTVLANKQVIIQDIPVPYWHQRFPFYLLKDVPLTREFWGMGEIDPIVDLCKELNDLRNQQNDNRNQFLKAFWVVDRNGNVDLDELEDMPPGGILEVSGVPDQVLNVMRPPQLDSMTFGAEQKIDADIQTTSGANDIAIGQPTRSQVRTATTGSLLAQSTDTRYGLTALLFLEQVRKVGRDWLALDQQFMSKAVLVRVVGQDAINPMTGMIDYYATPYDIPRQFDLFVAMGAEFQGDKELQRQQTIQLFSLMASIPGFNITEYAKEMLRQFDVKNPERYFEGEFIIPTDQILQKMGIDDKSVMSSFLEQQAGYQYGGTQRPNPGRNIIQAAGRPDMLQQAYNPGAMNAA